jgi:hypothetical protein
MTTLTHSDMRWQDVEILVRQIAELKFGAIARAETIGGVKCDCVLHLGDGSAVVVEISKQDDLNKLRDDIAKFKTIRPHFIQQDILPRCFFVTSALEPTSALIEAGKVHHVQVFSVDQFLNHLLGHSRYKNARLNYPFGSAVDLYSGEPDQKSYVSVEYFSEDGTSYSIEKIAKELNANKTIVLIGDYGTGKSRCVKEVFQYFCNNTSSPYRFPVAINLRENWGLKQATEIINRHFDDVGLKGTGPDIHRSIFSSSTVLLLDGFDEIGAQTWSDDPSKLVQIRKQSLVGVKDIISRARGGVLVTGREHYFNDDVELMSCLGVDYKDVLFLRCNQELTSHQFSQMIGRDLPELPGWVPKKPLIGTVIRDLEVPTIDSLFASSTGQIDFWELLITVFCEREVKINPILDATIIRSLYSHIGRLSRVTDGPLGPIAIKDINDAFEKITGRPPTDESAIILQRLPGLSRIGAESLDRQFVDSYILDGLKAEDLVDIFTRGDADIPKIQWKNPIESFGAFFLATHIENTQQISAVAAFARRNSVQKNAVLVSDMLSALFLCTLQDVDMGNTTLQLGRFEQISLSTSRIKNLILNDCYIKNLDVTDSAPDNVKLIECAITALDGVADEASLPDWIVTPIIENYQELATLSAIKHAGLKLSETFLLSSLRKLFLQPGAGRKESSMYKGYGDSASKKICDKVISLLLHYKFCSLHNGASETVYLPNRSMTPRVKKILNEMTLSQEDLWKAASHLSD